MHDFNHNHLAASSTLQPSLFIQKLKSKRINHWRKTKTYRPHSGKNFIQPKLWLSKFWSIFHGFFRTAKQPQHHYHSRLQKKNQGFALVFFITAWIPVVALLLGALHIQTKVLKWIHLQKKLDQCLYDYFAIKCGNLTTLSQSNRKLIQTITAANGVSALQAIPPLTVKAKATLKALKILAEGIVASQNILLKTDLLQNFQILQCGIPLNFLNLQNSSLSKQTHRPPLPQSALMGFPHPLAWKNRNQTTALEVQTFQNIYSTAQCLSLSEPFLLKGEDYFVSFKGDKFLWKR